MGWELAFRGRTYRGNLFSFLREYPLPLHPHVGVSARMHVICLYTDGGRGRVGIPCSCFLFLFHCLLFSFHGKASHHFCPLLTPAPHLPSGANCSPLEFSWQSLLLLQTPSLPALGCGSFHRMLPNSLYSPVVILLLLVYLFFKSLYQLNEIPGGGEANN